MTWLKTDIGWRSEPFDGTQADLLIAILAGPGVLPAPPDAAAAWARSFPHSTVVIFEQLDAIETRLTNALAGARLPPWRLLLVGLGEGSKLSLSLALTSAVPLAGALVYDPLPDMPDAVVPPDRKVKIRLIGHKFDDPRQDDRLGEVVRQLGRLGVDARATQLLDRGMTPSAMRIGAAYLAELSASALGSPVGSARPSSIGTSNEVHHAL